MSSHEMDQLSPIYPRYQDGQPLILQLDGEKFSNEIIFENESEVNFDSRKTVLHKTPKVEGPNKTAINFKQQPRYSERILKLPEQVNEEDTKTANFANSNTSREKDQQKTPAKKILGNVS